jgi:hypothetical protein
MKYPRKSMKLYPHQVAILKTLKDKIYIEEGSYSFKQALKFTKPNKSLDSCSCRLNDLSDNENKIIEL